MSYMSFSLETGEILMPTCHGLKYSKMMSISSRANLHLFYAEPPYWSVRLLDSDRRNESTKYPCAPCNSTPSKLHSLASLMLFLKSFLVYSISSKVIAFGTSWGMFSRRWLSRIAISDGPNGWRPLVVLVMHARPPWKIWRKSLEFLTWTALTTFFHPSACY